MPIKKEKCPQCKKVKSLNRFVLGYIICKNCVIYQKKYREDNKEKLLKQKQEYYKKNKKKIIKKVKEHDKKHKKEKQIRQHNHYLLTKDKKKKYNKEYNIKNKNKIRKQKKKYNKINKDKMDALYRKRRAKKKNVKENYTPEDRQITLNVFNYECFNCGKKDNLSIDHHNCLNDGNPLTIDNAVVLCASCNSSKYIKNPEEFYTKKQLNKINKLFKFAKRLKKQLQRKEVNMQENIKVESIDATHCKVNIEIPAAAVDQKFDEFFAGIKDKAEIPGFRKGKAPPHLLKQYFGVKARSPVVNLLLGEYYERMIRQENISPIGSPDIKDYDPKTNDYPGKFGFDNSYSVEFMIEVLPKLDPTGYVGLELNIPAVDESKLFDGKMNECRDQFAERKQIIDRGTALGDSIVLDFTGYIDNIPFEGGTAQGFVLNKLGSNTLIPGFEEQIIGMKPEESKKISVKFPDNYHAKHLAGKDSTFDVVVRSVVEAKPAEINADLALMAGFTSLDEMKNNINTNVQIDKQAIIRQKIDSQVANKLLEINKFDAPKSLVDVELDGLMKRISAETKVPDEFKEQLRKNAEFNVKRAMIFDAIYEKEKSIEITPDELDGALDEHAKINNKTKDELISALYNSKQMDNFVGVLRTTKVIDFIINNVKKGN